MRSDLGEVAPGQFEELTEQEIRQPQAQWARLGPVPADVAAPLNERFQRAVRRFYDSRRRAS